MFKVKKLGKIGLRIPAFLTFLSSLLFVFVFFAQFSVVILLLF